MKQATIISIKYTSAGKTRERTTSVKPETGTRQDQGEPLTPTPVLPPETTLLGHRQKILYYRQKTSQAEKFSDRCQPEP